MSKATIHHPSCWRLVYGKLCQDVPILLGMTVFEMWRRGPINRMVVRDMIDQQDGRVWVNGLEPRTLFASEDAAAFAKTLRRLPRPTIARSPQASHFDLLDLLVAHPTCRRRVKGRPTVDVPVTIGMQVFARVKGRRVGPCYVEAITDDEVLLSADDDAIWELHVKPAYLTATGKAERAARR